MRTDYDLEVLLSVIDDEQKENIEIQFNNEKMKAISIADEKPEWLDLHIIDKKEGKNGKSIILVLGK